LLRRRSSSVSPTEELGNAWNQIAASEADLRAGDAELISGEEVVEMIGCSGN